MTQDTQPIIASLQNEIATAQRRIIYATGCERREIAAYIKGLNTALYLLTTEKTAVKELAY